MRRTRRLGGSQPGRPTFAALIGPVRYFILNFVWRFLTDPIIHACWSGLTGYFIGLAASGRHRWYTVAWIGLIVAAILHGLNDWSQVNGRPLWIVISLISGILFLGYAKVGSRTDPEVPGAVAPASGRPSRPSERPPATLAGTPGATGPWWVH
jgi:hypothetical protein